MLSAVLAVLALATAAAQTKVRTGLEGLAWQAPTSVHATEQELVNALRDPLLEARDCRQALQHWFDGREANSRGAKQEAIAEWKAGLADIGDLGPIETTAVSPVRGVSMKPLLRIEGRSVYLLSGFVVTWDIGGMPHFGLFLIPENRPEGHRYPLFVFLNDVSDGLTAQDVAWLGRLARKGYAVLAPGLPGRRLLSEEVDLSVADTFVSSGDTDDLLGAVEAVWGAVTASGSFPVVRGDSPALVGVGVGGTVALLALGLSPVCGCVIAIDAWRINPFRFYWARMARGENLWDDWARFCSRSPAEQLRAMAAESPAHRNENLSSDTLLILPTAERESLNHRAHGDVLARIEDQAAGTGAEIKLMFADGDVRAFTRRGRDQPGHHTFRLISRFLYRHAPPDDGFERMIDAAEESRMEPLGEDLE